MGHFPENINPVRSKDETLDVKGNKYVINGADVNKHDSEIRALQMYLGTAPAAVPGPGYSGYAWGGDVSAYGFSGYIGGYPPPSCAGKINNIGTALSSVAQRLNDIRDNLVLVTSGTVSVVHPDLPGTDGIIPWPSNWPVTTLVSQIPDSSQTIIGAYGSGEDNIPEIQLVDGTYLNEDGGYITIINDVSDFKTAVVNVTTDSITSTDISLLGYTSMALPGNSIYNNSATDLASTSLVMPSKRVFTLSTNVEILWYSKADIGANKIYNVKRRMFGTTSTRHAPSDLVFIGRLSINVSPALYRSTGTDIRNILCLLRSNGQVNMKVMGQTTAITPGCKAPTFPSGQIGSTRYVIYPYPPVMIGGGGGNMVTDSNGDLYCCSFSFEPVGTDVKKAYTVYKFPKAGGLSSILVGIRLEELGKTPIRACYVDGGGQLYVGGTAFIASVSSMTLNVLAGADTPLWVDSRGFSGDGGPATAAKLNAPTGICKDSANNIYIADSANYRIRKITDSTGLISTIAGDGTNAHSGDGGLASAASLKLPSQVFCDASDNVYVVELAPLRVRKIDAGTGIITTIVGNGTHGKIVPGIATDTPTGWGEAYVMPNGVIYLSNFVSDPETSTTSEVRQALIAKVSGGTIEIIAGNTDPFLTQADRDAVKARVDQGAAYEFALQELPNGDGGAAINARFPITVQQNLPIPFSMAVDPNENILIYESWPWWSSAAGDASNVVRLAFSTNADRLRYIDKKTGMIYRVAFYNGTGAPDRTDVTLTDATSRAYAQYQATLIKDLPPIAPFIPGNPGVCQ